MTTAETVFEILTKEGGYRSLGKPIRIGSQTFGFTHVLVAGERANDLVIVIELTGASEDAQVTRSVLAFTRALDVPVSYTHLDVYKRQTQGNGQALLEAFGSALRCICYQHRGRKAACRQCGVADAANHRRSRSGAPQQDHSWFRPEGRKTCLLYTSRCV